MEIKMAKDYGFCFGVKRAIQIAEKNQNSLIFGSLIHNAKEINRLEKNFNVKIEEDPKKIPKNKSVIIRTHGIPKQDLEYLKNKGVKITDATCPYVIKPQQIVESMSKEGYQIVLFGDINHPEVKGVISYATNQALVINSLEELQEKKLQRKVALVSQTTKQTPQLLQIASYLVERCTEVRIFNTICNATSYNQKAALDLSKEVDIMIVVGGKTSSNTKQLLSIAKQHCEDSYLVEDENELELAWFKNKKLCGITAGASTPDWIIENVKQKISTI
ncbi:4-hydroxy-3-methylbut-2-enyl diphosphate reductase [Helicobacter pylori]|uniref:4-hydroxy-3-methylbut-2-enyl diphosphate reductase n=1 Tax=Helicobacter pylori (strain Shi470) TaxID=512562 RepID=ISPH_HELPS|nr:4-hydroxy-3-methylbut-2-enyl diphosphate reductase [Helicobacter pylori]B2UUG0.1 RecName: Full=4-hydroxy-3-methylbut-2-enyl diphosphate reductase; Short=HMBPP reductase [Helicobacter pylori Shi470]ACD48492.1 4-hydroxy-3-methylbut-2-enyl diphosphate reductase [Helicobacter pylori Shi470]QQX48424.1 4-hydroxy-3-methylbut-2-enyl diphosphate reductase [Helicobacter pylori]